MSDTQCPSCGAATEHWKRPAVLEVQNPFWARIELAQTLCPCGAQLRRARANYAEAEPSIWTRDNEMLKPFVDYRIQRMFGANEVNRLPTALFWAWCPMRHTEVEEEIVAITPRGWLDLP